MIGLVLVTHGRLAEELRLAMEHVVGPQRAVATVCIGPADDIEGCRTDIRQSIGAVDQGDGVVLLTDILGGTPSNLALSLANGRVKVIAGVNLPMLVKFAKIRGSEPLLEAVDHAAQAGRKYITAGGDPPHHGKSGEVQVSIKPEEPADAGTPGEAPARDGNKI